MLRRVVASLRLLSLLGMFASTAATAFPATAFPAGATPASAVPAKVRVITVEMQAIRYASKLITVKAGEPIDLRFRNTSTLTHEALIGDEKAQDEHEKMMTAMAMEGADTKTMVTVKAGATKTLRYTFAKAGRTIIGCHEPGHYGSGMKLTVIIQPRTAIG